MRLWNDYEGTTIAGAYPIEKLIRPEGRSAFFSTSNGTGVPAVIRLIESINDEAEILNRWKVVADLKDAHLITLKKFGQTSFEGTPLIYVLMESTEADLAGILKERALTVDETRELATSLVGAVQALHGSDIVHEHIEPMNVLATGEIVKLRSDCVREAPEGEEGIALKKQDVHDLAVVLLQSLTRQRSLDAIGSVRLPVPFDQIIRNGMQGTWDLTQIAAALTPPPTFTKAPVAPAVRTEAQQIPLAIPELTEKAAPAASSVKSPQVEKTAAPQPARAPQPPRERIVVPVEQEDAPHKRWRMALAPAVIVVAAALGWHFLHKPAPANNAAQPVTTLADVGQPQGVSTATAPVAATPAAAPHAGSDAALMAANGDDTHRWHVVAFTYNHQDQAQHKADEVAQRNASLRPEVFSPSGGAPYLVTLGGAMTRAEATAFKNHAAGKGIPRDTYIQNYGSHPRTSRHRTR